MRRAGLLQFTLTNRARSVQQLTRAYQHRSQMSAEHSTPPQLERVITPIFDSLFENQMDVIQTYMEKLIGSNHPILNIAREFYCDKLDFFPENGLRQDGVWENMRGTSPNSTGLRALIVLLMSRAIGTRQELGAAEKNLSGAPALGLEPNCTTDCVTSIASKQKKLAEITEIIYAAYLLHDTVVELPPKNNSNVSEYFDRASPDAIGLLQDGNDIATLMGDLLLAKSSGGLAEIRNSRVTELMSNAIGDYAESQFLTSMSPGRILSFSPLQQQPEYMTRKNGHLLGSWVKGGQAVAEGDLCQLWFLRNQLGVGSLLGHSCYCSVLLGGHEDNVRNLAYKLGENFGLLLQASKEISYFLRKDSEIVKDEGIGPVRIGIFSLPVIHAVQMNTLTWGAVEAVSRNPFHSEGHFRVFKEIQRNAKAIERSMEMLREIQDETIKILSEIPTPSPPAVRILLDLIQSLTQPT